MNKICIVSFGFTLFQNGGCCYTYTYMNRNHRCMHIRDLVFWSLEVC